MSTESPPSSTNWLDTPARWDRLAGILERAGEAGYDSETYNQPQKTSPQHRAKVHHWSIAVLTSRLTSRGYHRARGWALPFEALCYEPLYRVLQTIRLWGHNAPHDEHAAHNMGRPLLVHDTLQWARVAKPGAPSYGLKTKGKLIGIETWALGKPGRDSFKELVTHKEERLVEKLVKVRECTCGRVPCRARSTSEWMDPKSFEWRPHERVERVEVQQVPKEVTLKYDVSDFNPGHPRWDEWVKYAVADAETAIELVDWLHRMPQSKKEYPWVSKHGF